jgi:hypothetical protein
MAIGVLVRGSGRDPDEHASQAEHPPGAGQGIAPTVSTTTSTSWTRSSNADCA